MGRGYVGANAGAVMRNRYEYAGSEFYDPYEFYDFLVYNLEMATDTKTYQNHIPKIGDLAVQFAQDLVVANGTYKTGKLHDSIRWVPTSNGISLIAPARDNRGSAYGGHIEYGFVGRDGMPHGPWPFLRPAVRMAAEASRGVLANEAAYAILYGRYDDNLQFGRANIQHLLNSSHNRQGFVNAVSRRFDADNSKYGTGRWRSAQHGIDHMGNLKSDQSDEGKAIYESFRSSFGDTMSSWDFRDGSL